MDRWKIKGDSGSSSNCCLFKLEFITDIERRKTLSKVMVDHTMVGWMLVEIRTQLVN